MTAAAGTAEPKRHSFFTSVPGRWAGPFVWGLWAGLSTAALVLVARYGSNVPWWDDWLIVPALAGDQPVTLGWLWEQYSETRLPLHKLVRLALVWLTRDFRAVMVLNALALGVAALALIVTARRVRGHTSFADAFFPLLLLHWGHAEVFLWADMASVTVPLLLAGGLLALVARVRGPLAPASAVLGGTALVLLPLSGSAGVFFAALLAGWLVLGGLRAVASGHSRGWLTWPTALTFGSAAVVVAGLCVLLVEGTEAEPRRWPDRLEGTSKVLAIALGLAGRPLWPASGLIVAGVLVITAAVLGLGWLLHREERLRAGGLLLFLTAAAGLAAAIGWRRPPEWGFTPYYGLLPSLGLCGAYLAWVRHGPPALRPVVQALLAGLVTFLFLFNMHEGHESARDRRHAFAALEADLRAGEPASVLVRKHSAFLHWPPPGDGALGYHIRLYHCLDALHRAGIGPFASLRPDPAFLEVPLPLKPAVVHGLTWKDGAGQSESADGYATLTVPGNSVVCGLRVRYSVSNSAPSLRLVWKGPEEADYRRARQYVDAENWSAGEPQTLTVWVHETIDELRIYPDDKPADFRIEELVLLLAPGTSGNAP